MYALVFRDDLGCVCVRLFVRNSKNFHEQE